MIGGVPFRDRQGVAIEAGKRVGRCSGFRFSRCFALYRFRDWGLSRFLRRFRRRWLGVRHVLRGGESGVFWFRYRGRHVVWHLRTFRLSDDAQ